MCKQTATFALMVEDPLKIGRKYREQARKTFVHPPFDLKKVLGQNCRMMLSGVPEANIYFKFW